MIGPKDRPVSSLEVKPDRSIRKEVQQVFMRCSEMVHQAVDYLSERTRPVHGRTALAVWAC